MPAPFETAEDRAAYVAGLGEDVTYTPSGGSPVTIKGIFEKDSEVFPVLNADQEVIGYEPGIQCVTSDLTGTVLAGTILADGTTYNITEVLPDGTGMTDLGLEEA